MKHGKHIKDRMRSPGVYPIVFVVLLCVVLTAVLIVPRDRGKAEAPADTEPSAAMGAEPADSPSETAAPESGALLESGSGLNDNFYNGLDYFGTASELTDEFFFLGKAGMAFDKNAQPIFPAITVRYGEDTVVKAATLYNADDRYEIYASCLDEFKQQMEGKEFLNSIMVVLEDPDAEELWAREITIIHDADLG